MKRKQRSGSSLKWLKKMNGMQRMKVLGNEEDQHDARDAGCEEDKDEEDGQEEGD